MKNVKTLLIFIIISACVFASSQRVSSLGGNVGFWADDDNSWTAFPHTINDSNLAQVSGLGSTGDHYAIVRWGDGTKWGFTWDQSASDDMINIQYGGGTFGATFGLSMAAADDGTTSTSSMGISGSYGMQMGFGDLGVRFYQSSADDGNTATTDDPTQLGLWVNVRRAQEVWLFDNMLVNFAYQSNNDAAGAGAGNTDAQTTMALACNLYTHIPIADNTNALLAMGFGYGSVANVGNTKDATGMTIGLPIWTFAVESGMTDWATCRMGVNAGYNLSSTTNSGATGAKDVTSRGGMTTSFAVGLGFNYGSFNLDMDVSEALFTNPVQHVTGYTSLAPAGATATLTYVW